MKRNTHYLKSALIFGLCLSVLMLFAAAGQAAEFKKEYKMQLNVPESFYWGMGATKFAELVKEKTKGQINIKPYYSSVLLKGAQLKSAQLVANGVIDCAMESTINISPVITESNIFSLPFFINNFENLDKMEYGETGKQSSRPWMPKVLWGWPGLKTVSVR